MFKCECGKEFEKPNSFNAHKSNCKAHFLAKYGSDEEWNKLKAKRGTSISKTSKLNFVVKKAQELADWVAEKHICEKCGKVMTEKYGSGRFCSQSCANSRQNTGTKYTCYCQYCGKQFVKESAKERHEKHCSAKLIRDTKIVLKKELRQKYKLDKDVDFYRIKGSKNLLVNTIADVENYMSEQLTCEICGKTIEEAVKWDSKNAPKRLCVDHDHKTMQFRGALCQICNRQLGWYEKNKEAINKYLDKDFPLEDKSTLD